jgi:homoserine O-acetyltransferase/O-succinyltransferase
MQTVGTYHARDLALHHGGVLESPFVTYKTHGRMDRDGSNVVLYPTSYGARHEDLEWLIGSDRILDPDRWFIVQVDSLGNGRSASPSNHPQLARLQRRLSQHDNLALQRELLQREFGIERLAMVYGWSMGAQQAYHWAVHHPASVRRIVALCGTARTTPHNRVFLDSLRAALTADAAWNGETFDACPERGLVAFARIYASWAVSQAFYRRVAYRELGFGTLEDYLVEGWEPGYRRHDPRDLLAMLQLWRDCDVSDTPRFGGDLVRALGQTRVPALILPAQSDLYFTVDDCRYEAACLPAATVRVIPSDWGHKAGNPTQSPDDQRFIRTALDRWLTADPSGR